MGKNKKSKKAYQGKAKKQARTQGTGGKAKAKKETKKKARVQGTNAGKEAIPHYCQYCKLNHHYEREDDLVASIEACRKTKEELDKIKAREEREKAAQRAAREATRAQNRAAAAARGGGGRRARGGVRGGRRG